MITNKLRLMIGALAVGVTVVGTTAIAFSNEPKFPAEMARAADVPNVLHCNTGYYTNIDWNVSDEEVAANAQTLNGAQACSSLITAFSSNGGKDGDLWHVGTSSAGANMHITLNKNIDAIGCYLSKWSSDSNFTAKINNQNISINSTNSTRYFIELDEPTNEISFTSSKKNNRFYIHSIGFYFKEGSPIDSGDTPEEHDWYDATLSAGENASACTVNEIDGFKAGTSKLGGSIKLTVPGNATKIRFYAAAWKGVSGLSLTGGPESYALNTDDGISNNSPFTLTGDMEQFLFETSISISNKTPYTLAGSSAKRFVIWGAQYFN